MIALLIIDMQNAYFEDPGLAPRRDELVRACNRLVSDFTEKGAPVLVVGTEHERDKSTWSLNMLEDDQGFIFRGSAQADFVAGLEVDGLPRLVKTRDSAFTGTDLIARLRNWGAEELVLAGVATHNCIAQTAADAFAHNFRVIYAEEAMASGNEHAASDMLRILTDEYRQPVLSTDDIGKRLDGI
ncbi:MAG: cysteine hydrolase [Actinomycetota bacterium]|nr:cysteine hydrolase [Actinomycetota bacterium]